MRAIRLALFILMAAFAASGQQKTVPEPAVKIPFAESLQAVVVRTDNWTATTGKAQLFERSSLTAKWKKSGKEFPIVVGRSGLAWGIESAPEAAAAFKKEGDGNAPAGMFPLTFAFGSSDAGRSALPYTRLESSTECVDDAASSHYNTIVDRMKVGSLDWNSSEKMLEVGEEYGLGVFVSYNTYPVRRGDGSCIFLHVWKDAETPTSGCTAMDRADLERVVAWLNPARNPYLVQLPRDEYKRYRKAWNLPKF